MNPLADFRFAIRSLRRRPGFSVVAVGTLAVGIGATTSIFSVANGVLLRSLPYPEAHELVALWEEDLSNPAEVVGNRMSHPNFRDVRAETRTLESVAQYTAANLTVTGLGQAELVPGARVTPDFFRVFGAEPVMGRAFTAEESRYQGSNAVVVGESFWRTRLGGDPNVVGTALMIQGTAHEVVGVAPAGFRYPSDAQLWVPVQNDDEGCGRGCVIFGAVGRLNQGVSLEQAQSELASIAARLRTDHPETNPDLALAATSLRAFVVGEVEAALWILLGAVGMVLLIACANVANLVLVRGGGRRTELAVRAAIGASRPRLVAQLMTENAALAVAAGVLGLLLASWGTSLLLRIAPADLPRLDEIALDGTTLVFALLVVSLTVLIFGLVPALRIADEGLAEAIRRGSRGAVGPRRGHRVRATILGAEVALSVLLLVGAGLMVRSLARMQTVELGIEPDNVAIFRLSLPSARYAGPDERVGFMEQLDERLSGIPGVEKVATTVAVPFGTVTLFGGFNRSELPAPEPGQGPSADYRVLDADAADVLGLRVARGRGFRESDRSGAEPVVLVNETAARRFWPGEDPVGKRMSVQISVGYAESQPRTIIGVIEDFRTSVTGEPAPMMLVPYAQAGASFPHVAIKYDGVTAASVLSAARHELAALDPELPMAQPGTLDQLVARQIAASRFYLVLLSLFAAMAVALAAVGVYGLVAYLVVQRTREIGMRMALGARVEEVIRMVVWQGLGPALTGLAIGLAAALAFGRVLSGLLYQVEPTDPLTIAAISVLLLLVVVAATALPARRASRIPPADALRSE
ncbi:MAG TPA: ABC transporter permease [Longimicrobiales bacterium]|nr:ABC transporter permease [Longimicrobiales bacterium]